MARAPTLKAAIVEINDSIKESDITLYVNWKPRAPYILQRVDSRFRLTDQESVDFDMNNWPFTNKYIKKYQNVSK